MSQSDFRFKQFTIRHDRSAMKVGTDGVLLGAWSALNAHLNPTRILDVGTGSGLIALMMAQRFEDAEIDGIDIDSPSVEQAKDNVENSPFKERIKIHNQDFSDINNYNRKYHLIVSNPPFYHETTLSGNNARDAARHTHSLPFEELIEQAALLLEEEGIFSVIIPSQSASDFISICAQNKLYLSRRLDVKSTEKKSHKRALLEFTTAIHAAEMKSLTLYDENQQRSEGYAQLTKDFYL